MPLVAGARSHAFADTRDPAWLRRHLEASAERVGDKLRITLRQPAPGHAYPTGDLFRRLEVGAEVIVPGKAARREVRHLARHFQLLPGTSSRKLVRDDRVEGEPVVVELDLGGPATASSVSWWVTYQRVATVGAGVDPTTAKVESEVRLHTGEVR